MAIVHLELDEIEYSRTKTVSDFTSELLKRNDKWISDWATSPAWHLSLDADEAADADWLLQKSEEVAGALTEANSIQDRDCLLYTSPSPRD